ncbi:SANT/Myb-like DNA-binding domain-containing protein [Enterobacteriaceae bacterium C34A]
MNRGDNPRNHRTRWTLQELHYLEMNYGKADTAKIAEVLGRSVVSVRLAAKSFGCRKIKVLVPWSKEEIQILRDHYSTGEGLQRISKRLPGRSIKAIATHARKLGIQSGIYLARSWSEKEVTLLEQYYPTLGVKTVAKLPGRTENALKLMARKLGIEFQGGKEHGAHQRIWTQKEWQKLEDNFHLSPLALLEGFPGRSVTSIAKAKERLRKWRKKGIG